MILSQEPCECAGEAVIDLVDYCARKITQIIVRYLITRLKLILLSQDQNYDRSCFIENLRLNNQVKD